MLTVSNCQQNVADSIYAGSTGENGTKTVVSALSAVFVYSEKTENLLTVLTVAKMSQFIAEVRDKCCQHNVADTC